jgi:protein transport protein SEC24
MIKSKPLKGKLSASVARLTTAGGNVTSDVRAHYMRTFRSLSVVGTMNVLYPRLLAIHDLKEDVGFPAANGRLKLPRFMRASYSWMVAEGAYLLCTLLQAVHMEKLMM